MRVIFDTNVLVSAFVFPGGLPEDIFGLALDGRVQLITSRELLTELGRVLIEKFRWSPGRAEETVAQVLRVAEIVRPVERVNEIKADPADNRVLEAAVAGETAVIVSGDRHLLRLKEWQGIPLEPPAVFVRRQFE